MVLSYVKRGVIRSRKANVLHEIYFFMFQIVMVIIVGIALFQYVNNVATDLGFVKKYTALDIGLITTVAYYAPGTLVSVYTPALFPVQMDFIFAKSTVDVKERGKELDVFYWFLQDRNLEPLTGIVKIEASDTAPQSASAIRKALLKNQEMIDAALGKPHVDPNVTYYKAGRQISFEKEFVNPLQLLCPSVNTTSKELQSEKITLIKLFKAKEDYAKQDLSINRVAQILQAKHPQIKSPSGAPQVGAAVSAIPQDSKLVIILGDAGEKREPGSLVAYFPANNNSLKARKLSCFIINDILTPKTTVFYTQVMPVYVDSVEKESPLSIFKEKSGDEQVLVFIDFSTFTKEQVNPELLSDAIYRAIERYFGGYDLAQGDAPTLSFTSGGVGAIAQSAPSPVQSQAASQPSSPASQGVAP